MAATSARKIFNMSREFTRVLDNNSLESLDIIKQINPETTGNKSIADCPANIAAAMRTRLNDICVSTYQAWEEFKAHKSSRASDHLAVVIPYCPEGPTSGTVGMLIGAALRRYFRQQGKSRELVVWGIELCNPSNIPELQEGSSPEGEIAIGNDFRGYVARAELCSGGVALDNRKEPYRNLPSPLTSISQSAAAKSAPTTKYSAKRATRPLIGRCPNHRRHVARPRRRC